MWIALHQLDHGNIKVDKYAERGSLSFCTPQGELNGHKGLVPSNFLEEVPDDVEVFLTDSPSRYTQDTPARIKTKRVHAPLQY